MLDEPSDSPPDTYPGTRRQGTVDGAKADMKDLHLVEVSRKPIDDPGSSGHSPRSVAVWDGPDDDDLSDEGDSPDEGDSRDDEPPDDPPDDNSPDDEGSETDFSPPSTKLDDPDVEPSPWVALLDMLDATDPESCADDRPVTPDNKAEGAHALELRAESIRLYAECGAERTGERDRTEVGVSDDNRDIVAGRDEVAVDGMLDEHTGHGLVHIADEVEMNVGGPLRKQASLEDNIIMAGVMRDEFGGGTLVTAAMSDDLAAGLGLRCTAPLDLWVHGLTAMEERPGTCAADVLLCELAGTLYEREYGPSAHVAAVARYQGTVATTMKTGFRPLFKTALGVRNLIPGGGGGGGSSDASPPAAPPAAGGEAAGAATLATVESGGALGRGAADSGDADEIVSAVRTAESASDATDVENLQHPATTADNLDDLARVDAEGGGYQQVAEATDQPVPAAGSGSGPDAAPQRFEYKKAPDLDLTEPGAEGYDFRKSYDPLRERVEFYRADSNWRGNLISREHLQAIDTKAKELFQGLGGDAAALAGDNYGYRTSNIYAAMEQMARDAEAAEDLDKLAKIRSAMAELEGFVQSQLVAVAARTDEFAGTALGSQRASIDPNIDTQKLRAWLKEHYDEAENLMFHPATPSEDRQAWSWRRDYYDQLLKTLDAGMDPLAESSEQISFIQITKVDTYYANWPVEHADEIAEAAAEGYVLIPPRPDAQHQVDLFTELHDGLLTTLSNPEFFRSADEMGLDAFTPTVRARIEAGLDDLMPDLRPPLTGGDAWPPLSGAGFADGAAYVDEVRDRSFARSALAASEETLERQAAGFTRGDASVRDSASVPDSAPPEPSLGSRRAPTDNARAPSIDERTGRWNPAPHAEPDASPATVDRAATPARGDTVTPRASEVSWESGIQVSGEPRVAPAAGGANDVDTSSLFKTASEPGDFEPAGAAGTDTDASTARSGLYDEPASFEGRSLQGVPPSDDPKELAQALDGADIPADDLPRFEPDPVEPDPAEPARKSMLGNSDGTPVSDTREDVDDIDIEARRALATHNKSRVDRGSATADGTWSGGRSRGAAARDANARWSESTAAQRSSAISFSDDARQLLYRIEHERTVFPESGRRNVGLFRDADPPNTVDRAHAAHYIPRPRGGQPAHETGFGRLSHGRDEFPFSQRERILNTLHKGEALSPDQIISLEFGLESYRAAGGELSSSQYRAMTDMISDLGDRHRHARWYTHGAPDENLVRLVEMLDHAAMV